MIGFSYPFVVAATAHIYLPVYFKLQAKSVHYYLELRFNRAVRIFASVCFILLTCIYLAIVVYAPALALAQGIIHKWHHHILRPKGPFTLGENRLLIDPFTPLPVCLLVCLSICLYIMHVCLNVSVFLISFGPSIQQCLYFLVPLSLAIYGIIYEITEVTGMNMDLSIGLTFIVCIFYTALGGIKAVIWTNVFQVWIQMSNKNFIY